MFTIGLLLKSGPDSHAAFIRNDFHPFCCLFLAALGSFGLSGAVERSAKYPIILCAGMYRIVRKL
jgi:hypothetical protein